MRSASGITTPLFLAAMLGAGTIQAMRPIEKRENADYVISGTVAAVYIRETKGYRDYVVEISVEKVEKGSDIRTGDIFRALCYQRKPGMGGLEFDTAGHKTVPKEGQRVTAFVMRLGGRNEGVSPDWIDILGGASE